METINKSALVIMNDLGYFYTDPLFLDMEHLEDKLSALLWSQILNKTVLFI